MNKTKTTTTKTKAVKTKAKPKTIAKPKPKTKIDIKDSIILKGKEAIKQARDNYNYTTEDELAVIASSIFEEMLSPVEKYYTKHNNNELCNIIRES
ncbi:MAG: hypothetical protein WC783_00460 [Candidatus Paceibacterota bacterium]|jgi:hypothetical protein